MCHQFVSFFAGSIKRQGVIYIVMHRKRHGGVCSINAGTTGVNQVTHFVVSTPLQNVRKTNDVAVHIGQRIFDGIADSGLSGEVDHALWFVISKGLFNCRTIC